MRQNVVGIDIRDLLGNNDRFVEAVEVLQRPAQSMQRIGELWISRHRLPVFFDRLLVMAFQNQIKRGVVVVLGQLAGVAIAELAGSSSIGWNLADSNKARRSLHSQLTTWTIILTRTVTK